MICIKNNHQGAEILTDYCAGSLDPVRASELRAHIQECVDCRKLTEAQRAVWELLDEALRPIEVSADFDSKLYARIAQERTEPAWLRWSSRIFRPGAPRPFWKPVASLAAVGAVLFLAIMRIPDSPRQLHPPSAGQIQLNAEKLNPEELSSEKIDVDQVEQALEDMDMLAPLGQASGQASSSKL